VLLFDFVVRVSAEGSESVGNLEGTQGGLDAERADIIEAEEIEKDAVGAVVDTAGPCSRKWLIWGAVGRDNGNHEGK
jgi:hypothetical protein